MRKWDNLFLGFVSGCLGAAVGVFIFYVLRFQHLPFVYFLEQSFMQGVSTELISLGAVFNLALFFLYLQLKMDRTARGIILATLLLAFGVAIMKAVA